MEFLQNVKRWCMEMYKLRCPMNTGIQLLELVRFEKIRRFYWNDIPLHIHHDKCLLTHSHLRVPLESIVCYAHTFGNNFEIKRNITKYLKESCYVVSDKHFSFIYFPKDAIVRKNICKIIRPFWAALSVNGLINKYFLQFIFSISILANLNNAYSLSVINMCSYIRLY